MHDTACGTEFNNGYKYTQSEVAASEYRKTNKITKFGHYVKPKRASATAPLRTGADICEQE